nr:peptide chain release factor N(5)-glutamine methyltransferase [Nesterenkonia sp. F]
MSGPGPDLEELMRAATARLAEAGVPSPRVDAELLAAHVLGVSRGRAAALVLSGARFEATAAERFDQLVAERVRRVPLQHLTGVAPFRDLQLRVGPGVFVPRPETEQVAQIALDRLHRLAAENGAGDGAGLRVLDLGTGSGALAAAVAAELPGAEVHAVEVSAEAAAWAALNLEPLGVHLHRTDLRDLPEDWAETADVVVSNPPYIPASMVPVETEVREHDPEVALYGGGQDGLSLPHQVVEVAAMLLRDGGWFIMEHAEEQAEPLAARCTAHPRLTAVRTHQDLTGRDRATSAARRSSMSENTTTTMEE